MKKLLNLPDPLRLEHRVKHEVLRYIILGISDGVLFALGILLVTLGFAAQEAVKAWIGGVVTAALTNSYGAYFAERSFEEAKLYVLEKHLLKSLKGTIISERTALKVRVRVLAAGASTLLGGLLPASFFFMLPYPINAISGIILALTTLALTGLITSKKERIKIAFLYTGGGVLVAALTYVIGQIL